MALRKEVEDNRTTDQLREHYLIERDLAQMLRNASPHDRRSLYHTVYEEMLERVPCHPELVRKKSPEQMSKAVSGQLRLLRRFLREDQTFLEVGPGDCSLSFAVASIVRKVYAIDVSSKITENATKPPNFELLLSDGCSIDVPAGGINLAYSNQLMEHLHPDEAQDQLQNIYRALAPGGVYVCITPNRLNGPHDISRKFAKVASGFHLREYTLGELSDLFYKVGFSKIDAYTGLRGNFVRLPIGAFKVCEALLIGLPYSLRLSLSDNLPLRLLMPIRLVGTK